MTAPSPDSDSLDSLNYSLSRYRAIAPSSAFPGGTAERIASWKVAARTELARLIGLPTGGKVPLDVKLGEPVKLDGYTRRRLTFATRPDMSALGYLLVPESLDKPAPAVLCIPGHGRGVDEIVAIDERGKDKAPFDGYQHDFAIQVVQKGYVALALEPLGFGYRRDPAARKKGAGASSCQPAAGAALMLGETMAGWRTWDSIRAIDLMTERPEVDPKRIAMMGISGGGTVILYTAALDDRVKVSVMSGSFCTFRDSVYSVAHCIDNYVPGILKHFEAADIAGLIAPRYLFCESGSEDTIFPEPGVRVALQDARRIFKAQDAEDHLDFEIFSAGHVFHGVKAFERLKQWL